MIPTVSVEEEHQAQSQRNRVMKKSAGPSTVQSNSTTTSKSKSAKSVPVYDDNETFVALPPDGGWGWVVVFATFYAYAICDGIVFSYGIFLDRVSTALDCSTSEVSLVGAIQTCFFCLSGPFSAALINRFGFRIVATAGCLLAAISCGLTSVSNKIYQIILAYGIMGGIGFGMVYVSGIIVVGFYFERWRGLACGVSLCGAGVGTTIFPPILTILVEKVDWRNTFGIMALMVLSCIIGTMMYKPIQPVKVKIEPEGGLKRNLSHISEVQETKSNRSHFFLQYNNAAYPSLAEGKASVVALLRPPKISPTKSTSSEIMTTNLVSETSQHMCGKITTGKSKCLSFSWCDKLRMCRRRRETKIQTDFFDVPSVKQVDVPARPMYRDDIFYTSSIITLPEYKKSQASKPVESKSKSVLEYHISVTRTTTRMDVEEQKKCRMCPEAVKRTLATMLDFRLMKSPSFLLLVFNSICIAYAFYTPFIYIKDRGVQNGISPDLAYWLISAMGAMNTVGRVFCGVLSSFPNIRAHILCAAFLFVGGVVTLLSELSFAVWAQFLYAAVYGLSISSISTLRTIIIVDILGLEKLTNAVGMILLFQGVASLIGTALSGFLRDVTGNYAATFYCAGAMICLGSLFLIPIRHVSKIEKKKKTTN